jgi:hypothetical protein
MPIVFTPLASSFDAPNQATGAGLPLSVGSPVEFTATFQTDVPVAGGISGLAGTLYATVDLFVPVGSANPPFSIPGAPFFAWQIDGTTATATPYDMNYSGTPAQQNGEVSFTVDDSGVNYVIEFAGWFVLLEDTNGSGAVNNARRLLFNAISAATALDNTAASVFRQNRMFRLNLRHFVAPATVTGASLTRLHTARWYDRDLLNAAPVEFSNMQTALAIGVNPVSGIGSLNNTDVQLTFDTTLSNPTPIAAWVYLIRTDTTNNAPPWPVNYAGGYAEITSTGSGTLALPAPYDSRIVGLPALVGPSAALAFAGLGQATCQFTVDAAQIIAGARYRFVAVLFWEDGGGDADSYSFISDEYGTFDTPAPCSIGINGNLYDYRTEYPNHLQGAVPYERLRAVMYFQAAPFEACRPGQSVQQTAAQIGVTIYEESGTTRYVFAEYLSSKSSLTTITSGAGPTAIWDALNAQWHAELDFRIRWEGNLPNLYDLDTTTNTQNPPTQTQDWSGRTLWIEWSFLLQDGANEDEFRIRQRVDVVGVDDCFTWELRNSGGDPINTWCEDLDAVQVCVYGCAGWLPDDELIFAAVPAEYPLVRLREFDPNTGLLPQLGQPPIFLGDGTWDGDGRACFFVDATQVPALTDYRFVVIRKPYIAPPAEPCVDCFIYVGIPLEPYDLFDLAECYLFDMRGNFLA